MKEAKGEVMRDQMMGAATMMAGERSMWVVHWSLELDGPGQWGEAL